MWYSAPHSHQRSLVGGRTPLIHFLAGVKARPYWLTISPGSGWPDDKLGEAIQDFFYAGRSVYVDFDPELWQKGAREISREAAGLEMIKREYRLEHIRDYFYRILGRNAEALEQLKKAASEKDVDGEVLDHLAQVYAAMGQADAAQTTWKEAVEAFKKAGEEEKMKAVEGKLTTNTSHK